MSVDYIPPYAKRYLTLNAPPEGRFCRIVSLPDDPLWIGLFDGLFGSLTNPDQWRQTGDLDEDEMAEEWLKIYQDQTDDPECGSPDMPTPFWDEAQDLDDELPADEQIWYGEVTDPEAPADELEFIENAAIWLITGFIAYAGQVGGAIFFNTVAPRFVLAWKRGDIGEVIRVVIDSVDYGRVDTGTVGIGEIIELNVLPDPELSTHDIMLIKVE